MISTKKLLYKILSKPIVVESGTSGIWSYRKWSDSTSECWGTYTKTMSIASGSHTAVSPPAFPSNLFLSPPFVTASGGGAGNPNVFVTYTKGATENVADIYMRNMSTAVTNLGVWVCIYAVGTWK